MVVRLFIKELFINLTVSNRLKQQISKIFKRNPAAFD